MFIEIILNVIKDICLTINNNTSRAKLDFGNFYFSFKKGLEEPRPVVMAPQ